MYRVVSCDTTQEFGDVIQREAVDAMAGRTGPGHARGGSRRTGSLKGHERQRRLGSAGAAASQRWSVGAARPIRPAMPVIESPTRIPSRVDDRDADVGGETLPLRPSKLAEGCAAKLREGQPKRKELPQPTSSTPHSEQWTPPSWSLWRRRATTRRRGYSYHKIRQIGPIELALGH